MSTNAQIVSDIINDLKALSVDDRISKRFVLSKLRDKASLFIKRENDLMKLFRYGNLFTTVPCVKMIPANERECCDIVITKCNTYMKSEKRIPNIYTWRNGNIIQSIISIGGKEYKEITARDYDKVLKREFVDTTKGYFWFEGGYLVIPGSEVEYVEITAFFENEAEAKKLSDCPTKLNVNNTSSTCSSPLDEEFKCPAHLRDVVKEATLLSLFNFYKRGIVDELPNLNSNQKTNNADLKL